MKKILKSLLIITFAISGVKADTAKTFDKTRPYGVNLAMEYTTWNELVQMKDDDRFGADFQITTFYQNSNKCNRLGEYFGVNNKNDFKVGYLGASINNNDVNLRYMLHDYNAGEEAAGELKIEYKPTQEAYGLRIDYYQDLHKILKGLYLKVALPIVHVENDMELNVHDASGTLRGDPLTTEILTKFFKGDDVSGDADENATDKLEHAKIMGDQSTTDVADIDVVVGWKFCDREKLHVSANLGLTIPSSCEATGHWVFEPGPGNNGHWGFGPGLDFGINLWTKKSQNIKIESAANYRYLFEEDERRTIALHHMKQNNVVIPTQYSQYFLLAKADQKSFIPAANVLTRHLAVTPGSQLDANIQAAYNNGGFRTELGFEYFWKDAEKAFLDGHWKSETYYLAALNADATAEDPTVGGVEITKHNLAIQSAATIAQTAYKIYGGLGYMFKDWEYPLLLGLAAQYQWSNTHKGGIENWGVWGKLGIAF